MAGFKSFKEFNPSEDDWQIYEEQIEQYFGAHKIGEEKDRIALLLRSIAAGTYKLLRDLCHPDLPKTKTYEELTGLLKKQYSPHTSTWRKRQRFYQAKQENGEPITDWYARIRCLTINCEFKANLNHVLTDKFICGMKLWKSIRSVM